MTKSRPQRIMLGRIAGAHGIRGEVLLRTFTDTPEKIAAYGRLTDESGSRSFEVSVARVTAKGVVARIEGVRDRNAAEHLAGLDLYVPRSALPDAGSDLIYHVDLVGLAALNEEGRRLGEVVSVQNFGAGDLLEILLDATGRAEFIPFTKAFVPNLNIDAGHVTVVSSSLPDEAR